MKKLSFWLFFIGMLVMGLNACDKDDNPDTLLGETDIPLTEVGGEIGVYAKINGKSIPFEKDVIITANDKGVVTYEGTFNTENLTIEEKQKLLNLLPTILDRYKSNDTQVKIGLNTIDFTFKIKMTSQGFQKEFENGNKITIKYDDPLGQEYKATLKNGEVLTGKVTEKTGKDEFELGFLRIKTSKIEFTTPDSDPAIKNMTIRINHKFGIVFMQLDEKGGDKLEMNLIPWHVVR